MKVFFIHIPKAAGVSIHFALEKAGAAGSPQKHFFYSRRYTPVEGPTLACVRNPFDRVYSLYQFYSSRERLGTWSRFLRNFSRLKKIQFNTCFDFVQEGGRVAVDNIIKFEILAIQYGAFCKAYDIPYLLQHENRNEDKPMPDKCSIYAVDQRQLVYDIFENDFKHFGYSYEQWVGAPWPRDVKA